MGEGRGGEGREGLLRAGRVRVRLHLTPIKEPITPANGRHSVVFQLVVEIATSQQPSPSNEKLRNTFARL